jgi:hypothetical protein
MHPTLLIYSVLLQTILLVYIGESAGAQWANLWYSVICQLKIPDTIYLGVQGLEIRAGH